LSAFEKILLKVLRGTSDANISFDDLCKLLEELGFDLRINGSHHIFTREDLEDIINLQPKHGKAKPYQVKQVRKLILEHQLGGENNES
jgi:predicted RNA binding protein YcfA (HicA-like mRNA interferase family)